MAQAASCPAGPAATPAEIRFGAANVASVRIDATPGRVWRILEDRARWMPGFVAVEHIDGPVGGVGDRFRYSGRGGADAPVRQRVEEVLARDPGRRLVLRLADPDDCATQSFAELMIEPKDGAVELRFAMYWLDTAPAAGGWDGVRKIRSRYAAATQTAIEGHLARIKAAAEAVDTP